MAKRITVSTLSVWIILQVVNCVNGFNIDTAHPIIYDDPRAQESQNGESHFGYTVQIVFSKTLRPPRKWVLIGAPKSNSSHPNHQHLFEPGVVYKCDLDNVQNAKCQTIILEQSDVNDNDGDRKHQSWLGGTIAASSPQKGTVAVCGHRWSTEHIADHYYMNGVCYLSEHDIPETTDLQKRIPLKDPNEQRDDDGSPVYGYGQAGISAHIVTNEKIEEMIIGAPGTYHWRGSVIRLKNVDGRKIPSANQRRKRQSSPRLLQVTEVADVRKLPEMDLYDYFGYSVHAGLFFSDHKVFYVTGAPRAAQLKGKVYIYEFLRDKTLDIRITKEGSQLGEYFGASVLSIDLNGDQFDDLLVGAPLHSAQPDFADRSGDEGKVYVYINKQGGILEEMTPLVGNQSTGARFGSTIAAVGDMNLDGYKDFVVGAPYEEGGGAIYLYLGGPHGVHYHPTNGYWQRIAASDFPFALQGFGISISSADVDSNEYPDLVVGSYLSNQALVFRTKPIVSLKTEIRTSTEKIDPKISKLTQMEICSTLESPTQQSNNICVTYTLRADIDYPLSRVALLDERSRDLQNPFNFSLKQKTNERICRTVNIRLVSTDYSRPIRFRLMAESLQTADCTAIPLYSPGSQAVRIGSTNRDTFRKTQPTLDQQDVNYKEHSTAIVTGCGDDNKCTADLQIEAEFATNKFVIGSSDTLKIKIKVNNHGEPAYSTAVELSLPAMVSIRQGSACRYFIPVYSCSLADNLDTKQTVSIDLELDVSGLESGERQLMIDLEAKTASDLVSNSQYRTNLTLTLPLETSVDVGITGVAFREQQPYPSPNETFAGPERMTFQHRYEVHSHSASTLNKIRIEIWVPVNISTGKSVVVLVEPGIIVQVMQNRRVITSCNEGNFENPSELDQPQERVARHGRRKRQIKDAVNELFAKDQATNFTCFTKGVGCVHISCVVGSVHRKSPVTVTVNGTLLLKNTLQVVKGRDIVLSTNAKATILEPTIGQDLNKFPDLAKATSVFLPETINVVVAGWVTPVAALVGILVLTLLALLLYKLGFFKRHRYLDDVTEEEFENPAADVPESTSEASEPTEKPVLTAHDGHPARDDIERLDF